MSIKFRFLFNIIVIILFCSCSKHQEEKIENLLWSEDAKKSYSKEHKENFLDSVYKSVKFFKNDSLKTEAYLDIALEYYDINAMSKSNLASRNALKFAKKYSDKKLIIRFSFGICGCKINLNDEFKLSIFIIKMIEK